MSTWPRLVRILLAFIALSAVLFMHGMTGDHDLNVTVPPSADAAAAPSVTAGVLSPTHDHGDPSDHAPAGLVALNDGQAPTSDHHGHGHETQTCLALLTVSLVALGAMKARTRSNMASAVPRTVRPPWLPTRSVDVGARAPAQSALCILRT